MSRSLAELSDEIAARPITVRFTVAQAVAVVVAAGQLSSVVHSVDLTGGLAAIIACLEEDCDAFNEESMLAAVPGVIH